MFSKEAFLALAVLADVQNFSPGMNRPGLRDSVHDLSGNVFELERDDVDRLHECVQRIPVCVRGIEFSIRNLACRAIRRGLERMNSVAHPACCNAKHPTQLSTAQKADRRAWRYIRFHAFQSEEKRDARQEFKNSGVTGVQEFRSSGANTDGCEQNWPRIHCSSHGSR